MGIFVFYTLYILYGILSKPDFQNLIDGFVKIYQGNFNHYLTSLFSLLGTLYKSHKCLGNFYFSNATPCENINYPI